MNSKEALSIIENKLIQLHERFPQDTPPDEFFLKACRVLAEFVYQEPIKQSQEATYRNYFTHGIAFLAGVFAVAAITACVVMWIK